MPKTDAGATAGRKVRARRARRACAGRACASSSTSSVFDVDTAWRDAPPPPATFAGADGRAVGELEILERARREVAAADRQALDVRGDEGLVLDDVLELTDGQRAVHINVEVRPSAEESCTCGGAAVRLSERSRLRVVRVGYGGPRKPSGAPRGVGAPPAGQKVLQSTQSLILAATGRLTAPSSQGARRRA